MFQEAVIGPRRGGPDGGLSDGGAAAGDSSCDVQYGGAERVELHGRAAGRHTQHHPEPAERRGVAGAGATPVETLSHIHTYCCLESVIG